MSDSNKLVTLIALVIAGLIVAAWGAIFIWLYRSDQLVVADLQRQGRVTAIEVQRLTNPTWVWVLAIIQIILGVALILWGIFQYFAKVEDIPRYAEQTVTTLRNLGNNSRKVITTTNAPVVV